MRQALNAAGITGAGGAEIDHIELFGDAHDAANDSRNFVLCPGKAYDRSPCGTGTSAKMACLVADGKLAPGAVWRQEGILGTVFEGRVRIENGVVIPSITGSAYVTAESKLLFDAADPFRRRDRQLEARMDYGIRRDHRRRRHCGRGLRGGVRARRDACGAGGTRCAGQRSDGSGHGARCGDG